MNITLKIRDVGFRRSDITNEVQITALDRSAPIISFTVDRTALRDFLSEDNGIRDSSSLREGVLPGKLVQIQ